MQIVLKQHVVRHIRNFTCHQAEVFRHSLGINEDDVQALARESHATTGAQIALFTYEEWERRISKRSDRNTRKIIKSLLRAERANKRGNKHFYFKKGMYISIHFHSGYNIIVVIIFIQTK